MSNLKDIRDQIVTVHIGGKERTLRFDLNAFAELEDRFGSVDKAMKELQSGSMKSIKTIVWAGLIHEEAILDENGELLKYTITPYQVGSWLNPGNLTEVSNKLSQAIGFGLPDENTQATQSFATVDAVAGPQMAVVVLTPEEAVEEAKND